MIKLMMRSLSLVVLCILVLSLAVGAEVAFDYFSMPAALADTEGSGVGVDYELGKVHYPWGKAVGPADYEYENEDPDGTELDRETEWRDDQATKLEGRTRVGAAALAYRYQQARRSFTYEDYSYEDDGTGWYADETERYKSVSSDKTYGLALATRLPIGALGVSAVNSEGTSSDVYTYVEYDSDLGVTVDRRFEMDPGASSSTVYTVGLKLGETEFAYSTGTGSFTRTWMGGVHPGASTDGTDYDTTLSGFAVKTKLAGFDWALGYRLLEGAGDWTWTEYNWDGTNRTESGSTGTYPFTISVPEWTLTASRELGERTDLGVRLAQTNEEWSWVDDDGASERETDTHARQSWSAGITLGWRLSSKWRVSAGLDYQQTLVTEDDLVLDYGVEPNEEYRYTTTMGPYRSAAGRVEAEYWPSDALAVTASLSQSMRFETLPDTRLGLVGDETLMKVGLRYTY